MHYDAEAMLGVLALEAHRAGAVVIGEDLGTVEPEVTEGLAERNMLGSAVLWFTRDYDDPGEPLLPRGRWPERAVATISTHDLPTAAGFLRGEHVRVRAELGLLDDVAAEQAQGRRATGPSCVELLRGGGLLAHGRRAGRATELIVAMHELLARDPCRLVLGLALRRARRAAPAQPARHRRRVPELAAAAAGLARADRERFTGTGRGRRRAPRPGLTPNKKSRPPP